MHLTANPNRLCQLFTTININLLSILIAPQFAAGDTRRYFNLKKKADTPNPKKTTNGQVLFIHSIRSIAVTLKEPVNKKPK